MRADHMAGGVNYGFGRLNRRHQRGATLTGGTGSLTLWFSYNLASQIERRTRNNDSYVWTGAYDVGRNYSVNGLNQYGRTSNASGNTITSFTHDANGNLASSTGSSGTTSYTYDIENRLVAARDAQTADLRYDPLGRLFELGTGTTARHFLYDGDALVAEYRPTAHSPPGSSTAPMPARTIR